MSTSNLSNVELVMRGTTDSDAPTVHAMRDALRVAGGDAFAELAEEIPVPTAYRRAVEKLKTPAKEGVPGIATRVWTIDGGVRAQIDRETCNGRLTRSLLAIVDCNGDGETTIVEDNQDDGALVGVLRYEFVVARQTYTWADITALVRKAMSPSRFGDGTYTLRDGVWVVPLVNQAARIAVTSLEQALSGVGGALLRYNIPDSDAHVRETRQAIVGDLTAQLAAHTDSIAAYTEATAAGHVRNRLQSLEDMAGLVGRLTPILGDTHTQRLSEQISELMRRATEAERIAVGNRPARRIVLT
jgi:hypothetical protein